MGSASPSNLPSVAPSNLPSSVPSSLPSVAPSSLPSEEPSSLPSAAPSSLPSVAPSSVPTSRPSGSVFSGRFRISNKDSNGLFWCAYPKNNELFHGNPLVVTFCKKRLSHYWTIDDLGRIINEENKSLCISHLSSDLSLTTCKQSVEPNERWFYSFNERRILKLYNGSVGFQVSTVKPANNVPIKLFSYSGVASLNMKWFIDYESGGFLPVVTPDVFKIMSNLSTDGIDWCMFPRNNHVSIGTKIAIGRCK